MVMLDLGRVVYLDTQKTGSTFLSRFLSLYSGLPVLFQKKHSPIAAEVWNRAEVSVIMSVREPWSYYESLFKFGLDGKGQIYWDLRSQGKGHLYQPNEQSFLKFVTVLNQGHEWGLITRRLLAISAIEEPSALLASIGPQEASGIDRRIHIVRMEHMSTDLSNLATEWDGFGRLGETVDGADASISRNASSGQGFRLSDGLRHDLQQARGMLGEIEGPVLDIYARWAESA